MTAYRDDEENRKENDTDAITEERERHLWWRVEEDDVAGAIFAYVASLDSWQRMRQTINAENAKFYWGKDVYGIGGPRAIGSFTSATGSEYSITENAIASVVDTAVSLIAGNRPKPVFLTEGEGWAKGRQAKKLGQFVLGLYDRLKIYQLATRIFKDCCVFDVAALKVYADDKAGLPCVERVLSDDIVVDEQESRTTTPRQMHQRRWVDRGVLARLYPEQAAEIWRADASGVRRGTSRAQGNMVEVLESWHLPSEEGADDGLYVVCVQGTCLYREKYEKDYFPFVFLKWNSPLTGFYGQGIVEPLTLLQMDLNEKNKFIRRCQRAIIRPDIYGAFNQRMPDAFFETGVGRFFQTRDGKPPTFYTPQALNAETYNERERIVQRMFAIAGVGEMQAQGKKQSGVESGIAIREVNDIQAGRFGIQAEAYEDFHLEVAQRLVWCMRDLSAESGAKTTVAFRAKHFAQTIKWTDVDPKEDAFHVTIQAASLISRTPAGQRQEAMDLFQMSLIDKAEFRHLVNWPDEQASMDIQDAAFQYAMYAVEKICEGTFVRPEPFEDLVLCVKYTQLSRIKAKLDGAPGDVLEMLQLRIDMAIQLQQDAEAATAPPPAAPMGASGMGGPPGMDPLAGMGAGGMPGAPPQGMVPGAPLPGAGMPLPMA